MHFDIVFKAFVGILSAIVITGSGLGVVMGYAKAVSCENYIESVSKIMLESNFNSGVIEKCKKDASERGYLLEVNVNNATKAGVKKYAEVKLTYYLEMKLFGIKQEKVQWKVL